MLAGQNEEKFSFWRFQPCSKWAGIKLP